MTSEENSLEYIEDPYFNPNTTSTPSLDDELDNAEYIDDSELLGNELELFDLRQLDFDELNCNSLTSLNGCDENVNVEVEFFSVKRANEIIHAFFKKQKRQVRVTYCDLSKPYLAKLPKDNTFRKYLEISTNGNDDFQPTDPAVEQTEEAESEDIQKWRKELETIESEIPTLRTVLAAKVQRSAELKRKLGITVWKEVSDDINQGLKNVKESNVYQTVETKVGQVTKAVTDAPIYQKTTSIIGGITGNITNKIGAMRHSESFRSIEEKVGSAYENVKTKVGTVFQTKVSANVSRSGSTQSLNDARSRSGSVTGTTPTIDEDKPLH